MGGWGRIDTELDAVASDVRRATGPRVVAMALFGLVFAGNIGWRQAAVWTAAGFGTALWGFTANVPTNLAGRPRLRRLNRLAQVLMTSIIWTSMAVVYWRTGDPALRLVAFVILATLMVVAQSHSFKSLVMVATMGTLPAVAFILLPLASGFLLPLASGFEGFKLFSLVACSAAAVFYLVGDTRRNFANGKALRAAQEDSAAQREAAVSANQAKTAFLAMMSHELRTPMNGVLGMAHALSLTELSKRQANFVDMLVRSGKGLMAILNDLLDISKIEAGKLELEEVVFDLPELAQRVHDLWTETASSKGLRLCLDIAATTPRWVVGDPTRLRQVIVNLISNALKFTAEGEVRLSIEPIASGCCEFRVSDTGLGLSKEQQARLFQAFVQADLSTTRKFGGTGLGLAICKQLATLMGGEIRVASEEGKGAVFTVTIPLPAAAAGEADERPETGISLTGLRVLVAEDNAINQAVARAILEAFGASVTVAGDGREAIDLLVTGNFDVALMDVHMPRMDGLQALKHIRAAGQPMADMPVIALTADAMAGVDSGLLAAGFDDVAPKPIDPAELARKIAGVLFTEAAAPPTMARADAQLA